MKNQEVKLSSYKTKTSNFRTNEANKNIIYCDEIIDYFKLKPLSGQMTKRDKAIKELDDFLKEE